MSDVFFLSLPNARVAYRLYENPNAQTDRVCILLHGAGVAGEITFAPMMPYFTQWRWMLVPDLKGMGDSFHHHGEEGAVSIDELTSEMAQRFLKLDLTTEEKIDRLFVRVYGRKPKPEETQTVRSFLIRFENLNAQKPDPEGAWQALCQSLISSSEFLYLR